MGYARYTINHNGEEIDAGYGVEATCEEPTCTAQIDRGLYYLCGFIPGGDEEGCGGYFCGSHLYFSSAAAESLCRRCTDHLLSQGR